MPVVGCLAFGKKRCGMRKVGDKWEITYYVDSVLLWPVPAERTVGWYGSGPPFQDVYSRLSQGGDK